MPPPGFYELSDGGSCSLSTSCTSVCSDHMSCSLGTLLPTAPKSRPGSGDCRPRSADETMAAPIYIPTNSVGVFSFEEVMLIALYIDLSLELALNTYSL